MSTDLLAPLPESIREIAEVIGREEAFAFIAQLPVSGKRPWRKCVYIPKRLPADHKLVVILGWENAYKMSRAFTGMILQPSNGKLIAKQHRNREIHRMAAENIPVDDIADQVSLSTYRVREIIAGGKNVGGRNLTEEANHG